jgi:hypothetical protein
MPLDRWWRPRPKPLTNREMADEVGRRRAARGITRPNPVVADPLDEPEACADGCHPGNLFRVMAGPALLGSLICCECGSVYRKEAP